MAACCRCCSSAARLFSNACNDCSITSGCVRMYSSITCSNDCFTAGSTFASPAWLSSWLHMSNAASDSIEGIEERYLRHVIRPPFHLVKEPAWACKRRIIQEPAGCGRADRISADVSASLDAMRETAQGETPVAPLMRPIE